MARRIIDLFPPHTTYCEPFAGGLAVLLAKDPAGVSEVVNDINGPLSNFWRVLQAADMFHKFLRMAQATPFSEAEFQRATAILEDDDKQSDVERGWAFFVVCRQSMAGRLKSFAPISTARIRRGMNEQVSGWLSALEGLPEVHARLRRVLILNRNALDIIAQVDSPETLFYLDPPYLAETRASAQVYANEFNSEAEHTKLLNLIRGLKGKVVLSGYDSALYRRILGDWNKVEILISNHSASGSKKKKMAECLWRNY